jgi:hypothetical protein
MNHLVFPSVNDGVSCAASADASNPMNASSFQMLLPWLGESRGNYAAVDWLFMTIFRIDS